MKIVFLDASTLGDSSLQPIESLGELVKYSATAATEVVERCSGAEVVITNKVVLDAEVLELLPDLRLICVAATGMNCVDLEAAQRRGIAVQNVAGYSTQGVVQHTFGMLINLCTNLHQYDRQIETWPSSPIFTQLHYPIVDLAGKTLGIVGYGTIGKAVAKVAKSFAMEVIALSRDGDMSDPVRRGKEDFFSQADVVSLHCPLSPESENIINAESLAAMKKSAFLINTGRGPLVDEEALHNALKQGRIAGAALDVLVQEPPAKDHVLLQGDLENLMVTPHTAWASNHSRERLIQGVAANITSYTKH